GASSDVRRGGSEAHSAAWAAKVGHGVITSGSSRGDGARRLGRLGSSPGPLTARRSARSTHGVARALTHAEGARTRGSYRSVLDQVCGRALAAPAARSASRWPFRHRLATEAAALVQPTLGIRGVACGVAARNELNRACPVADVLCGSFCVLVGSKASRPREGRAAAGDDRPVVVAAVVLGD